MTEWVWLSINSVFTQIKYMLWLFLRLVISSWLFSTFRRDEGGTFSASSLYLLHRCKDDVFLITQVIWEHHSWIWDIVSRRLTIFLHLKSVNRENNCHLSATHLFRGCLFPSSGWNLNQQLFNVTTSDVVSTDAPASLLVDEQKLLDGTLKSPAAKYCSNI